MKEKSALVKPTFVRTKMENYSPEWDSVQKISCVGCKLAEEI